MKPSDIYLSFVQQPIQHKIPLAQQYLSPSAGVYQSRRIGQHGERGHFGPTQCVRWTCIVFPSRRI